LLILVESCDDFDLAAKYFPQATQFMPRPLNRIPAQLRMGTEFDFHSIMIYGSHMGKREDMMWYPLVTSSGQPIYMGDSPIPQFTRLSDGDVERIAALYPVDLTDPETLFHPSNLPENLGKPRRSSSDRGRTQREAVGKRKRSASKTAHSGSHLSRRAYYNRRTGTATHGLAEVEE
jgi:hypothetical protein